MPGRGTPPGDVVRPECSAPGMGSVHLHRTHGEKSCRLCRAKTAAHAREYRKRRYLMGKQQVDALGTQRRIRALSRMGWSQSDLARRLGVSPWNVNKILGYRMVHRDTARRFAVLYRELVQLVPEGRQARLTQAQAARKGWPGPTDWDDIDDPREVPLCELERCHAEALAMARRARKLAARREARAVTRRELAA